MTKLGSQGPLEGFFVEVLMMGLLLAALDVARGFWVSGRYGWFSAVALVTIAGVGYLGVRFRRRVVAVIARPPVEQSEEVLEGEKKHR